MAGISAGGGGGDRIDPRNPLPLWNLGGGGWGDLTQTASYRPAGLATNIEIESSADYNDRWCSSARS